MKEEIKRWIRQADEDFSAAKVVFEHDKCKAAAFWCQQTVEKGFKAILIHRSHSFPKIHDLTKLAQMVSCPPSLKLKCAKIDPAYTASRYPDTEIQFTKEECREILFHTEEVLSWIKKNLP